jgi:hypothetical protein
MHFLLYQHTGQGAFFGRTRFYEATFARAAMGTSKLTEPYTCFHVPEPPKGGSKQRRDRIPLRQLETHPLFVSTCIA